MNAETQKLARLLATLMAGEKLDTSVSALIVQLAATIGFASETKAHAREICGSIAGDLMRNVEANWKETRRYRAISQDSLRKRQRQ
jgi:hypothetical protein